MGWSASKEAVKVPQKFENTIIFVPCVDKTTGVTYLK